MNRVALITGATGFVGSHVAERMREQGFTVRLLVRDIRRMKWLNRDDFEIVTGDITDSKAVTAAMHGADCVIHCAGLTKALRADDYMRANAEATALLARAAEAAGLRRFVYCSSLAGCGPSKIGVPLTESDTPRPITPYGRSKLAGEASLQAELRNTEWVILRPPAVMGARDEQFVPLFRMMSTWRVYTEVGFKQREYSLIGVDDLARMLIHAATAERGNHEIFFATMPTPYVWRAVAEAFHRVSGKSALRVVVPEFVSRGIGVLGDLRMRVTNKPVLLGSDKVSEILGESWACSADKMTRLWGVTCQDDLDAVVNKTYRFYLQQKWI